MAGSPPPVTVLFVCLGNHCRSPAAHAVGEAMVHGSPARIGDAQFDSAGTGGSHVGDRPHPMAVAEGAHRGYHIGHRARQIHPDDFARFDLIVAMDRNNVDDLERLRGGIEHRRSHYAHVEPVQVQLLRRWDPYAMPGDEDLPDPWGKEPSAYSEMYDVIERSMEPLLDHLAWLRSEHPLH
jgi:protein-tyrosine phosphatase